MSIGIIGKKVGMTRVYDSAGRLTPVTVILAGGNTLLQRKTVENDGYEAVQVGFEPSENAASLQSRTRPSGKSGFGTEKNICVSFAS